MAVKMKTRIILTVRPPSQPSPCLGEGAKSQAQLQRQDLWVTISTFASMTLIKLFVPPSIRKQIQYAIQPDKIQGHIRLRAHYRFGAEGY